MGVKVSDSKDKQKLDCQKLGFDAVILAVGHSARDIYHMLLSHDIDLMPKYFNAGPRIENLQARTITIYNVQSSSLETEVHRGHRAEINYFKQKNIGAGNLYSRRARESMLGN